MVGGVRRESLRIQRCGLTTNSGQDQWDLPVLTVIGEAEAGR